MIEMHTLPILLALAAATMSPSAASAQQPSELAPLTMGFLRKGPHWTAEETPEHAALQARHAAYLVELVRSGDLDSAGPLSGAPDPDLRGVVLSRRHDVAGVEALLARDPKVRAGHLRAEVFTWLVPVADGGTR